MTKKQLNLDYMLAEKGQVSAAYGELQSQKEAWSHHSMYIPACHINQHSICIRYASTNTDLEWVQSV